jgi:hypothetical protein
MDFDKIVADETHLLSAYQLAVKGLCAGATCSFSADSNPDI